MAYKCQDFCAGQTLRAMQLNHIEQGLASLDASASIVCEVTGTDISLKDASDSLIHRLTIYGKTTQAATPAPTAPVQMKNIGPKITISVGDQSFVLNSTSGGLQGIPVYHKDSAYAVNYTDASGQKWICDEIDLARGVYIQRIFKIVLNGTEPWMQHSSNVNKFGLNALAYDLLNDLGHDKYFNDAFHLCSHFKAQGYYQATDGGVTSGQGGNGRYLTFWHSGCSTLDSWKAYLAAQYAAGAPVTVILRKENPLEIELPGDAVAYFQALHTRKGETTISNDASAHMEVSYVADTKMYIDNKFNELAAALVNNT